MSRRDAMRNFFIAVIAGLVVAGFLATVVGRPLLAWLGIPVAAATWMLSEWAWPRLVGVHLRWPVERLTDQLANDDLGDQVEALMDMPLHRWPVIRSRVAKLFPSFKLSAVERSVLVMWATFPLEGGAEIDYHVETLSPLSRWLLYATNQTEHPPRRLDGTIVLDDPEVAQHIIATHKIMVNQLRSGYVPSVRQTSRK